MSDHQEKPPITLIQSIAAMLAALLIPCIVIFMIVKLVVLNQAGHSGNDDPAAVLERIKPVGEVVVKGAGSTHADKTGEQIVTETCSACHATGVLNAPKIGNAVDWGPRIAQGYETLVKHALDGIRTMPARGGNTDLSDTEIAGAVAYMANKAGADFKVPAPKAEAAPAADAKAAEAEAPASPAKK